MRHKVFEGIAKEVNPTIGWFYGFSFISCGWSW